MNPIIGMVGLAGQYEVGFSEATGLLKQSETALKQANMVPCNTDIVMCDLTSMDRAAQALSNVQMDALLVCVCTWSEDHHLLDLLERVDKPVILWAYPNVESGSMCGVHQICCVLTEIGRAYGHVYGDPNDTDAVEKIRQYASAAALDKKLKTVRIGTVGGRIKGMTEIAFDEFEIKKRTGVRVVNIDEDELAVASESVPPEDARQTWASSGNGDITVTSPDDSLIESLRYYLGMKKLIAEYALEGIVVKCYPKYMGKICLGYSLLSEEGYVCGCEGDVNSTVMMKMLYELTGQPIHNTDVLHADPSENTLLFSHCGSGGFTLAESRSGINLAPVRLADSGVCALFTARPGIVTLANLVGRGGTMRMSVMTGEAMSCSMEFPGNPLKVHFEKSVLDINEDIADKGIGHHWMAGYGDVSAELKLYCRMKGIRYLD